LGQTQRCISRTIQYHFAAYRSCGDRVYHKGSIPQANICINGSQPKRVRRPCRRSSVPLPGLKPRSFHERYFR
jgi:hypothetical protein